jgi:hypothetical protein
MKKKKKNGKKCDSLKMLNNSKEALHKNLVNCIITNAIKVMINPYLKGDNFCLEVSEELYKELLKLKRERK